MIAQDFYKSKDLSEACKYFNRALTLSAYPNKIILQLAQISIKEGDLEKAGLFLQSLRKEDPDNNLINEMFAYFLYLKGNPQEALRWYMQVFKQKKEARIVKNMARIYLDLDKTDEVISIIDRFLKEADVDAELLYLYVKALILQGKKEKSHAYLLEYLSKNDLDKDSMMDLLDLFENIRLFQDVFLLCNKILEQNPEYTNAWFTKARISISQEIKLLEGINALRKALELKYDDSEQLSKLIKTAPTIHARQMIKDMYTEFNIKMPDLKDMEKTNADKSKELKEIQ